MADHPPWANLEPRSATVGNGDPGPVPPSPTPLQLACAIRTACDLMSREVERLHVVGRHAAAELIEAELAYLEDAFRRH